MNNSIKLLTDSILQVPLLSYERNFTFIVNEEQFDTTKIIADLISPNISKLHLIDPTINEYTITTQEKGNFLNILDLFTFKEIHIKDNEIEFVSEIFEKLGTEKVLIHTNPIEITIDNVIDLTKKCENKRFFNTEKYKQAIDFLSCHFFELNESQEKQISSLSSSTIEEIFSNKNLKLESEDQLLRVIDHLYTENVDYSYLYQFVFFENVEIKTIEEFLSVFDNNHMTRGTWLSLSKRLMKEIKSSEKVNSRYFSKKIEKNVHERGIEIPFSEGKLEGIFDFLRKNSNIKDELNLTFSSHCGGSEDQLIQINNTRNRFYTVYSVNPWICFEFKKRKIIPSNYTIRSHSVGSNNRHPKSWIIEGSGDGLNWIKLDEQKNCSFLNGRNLVHTFPIQNKNLEKREFKFIRMSHTDLPWGEDRISNNIIDICSIEFYGCLI